MSKSIIPYYLILILNFFLGLLPKISVVCIILLTCYSIYLLVTGKTFIRKHPLLFLLVGLYLFYALSFIYSDNVSYALADLEQKLSFIVIPLIAFTIPDFSKTQKNNIFFAFVAGCSITAFIVLGNALIDIIMYGNDLAKPSKLTKIVEMHHTYLSLYLVFSFFIILFFKYIEKSEIILNKWQEKLKVLLPYGFVFLLLLIYINLIILSSRMPLLLFTFILMGGTILYFANQSKLKKGIGIAACQFIVIFSSILLSPNTKNRFENISRDSRLETWNASFQCIAAAPLFGHGIGDRKDVLLESYVTNNMEYSWTRKLNAHNQYLDTTLAIGILGLIILLLIVFLPFTWSIYEYNYLFYIFLLLTTTIFLTESFLERQAGIVFYSFFSCFFASQCLPKKNTN